MANDVIFEDFTIEVMGAIDSKIEAALYAAAGEMVSQTGRNTRVDSGKTKGSWQYYVNGNEAVMGSPDQNSIWEEFGTGEYALNGDGRKGGWFVHESQLTDNAKSKMAKAGEEFYFTKGKKPSRAFWKAYTLNKDKIIRIISNALKGL